MSLLDDTTTIERFRAVIQERLGLCFDDGKTAILAEILRGRLEKTGRSAARYLAALDSDAAHAEFGDLAKELTVTETYFFRNHEQFRAFAEVAIPARMSAGSEPKTLHVLSAGCASGEEAYSIAMTAATAGIDAPCALNIRAVDVNPLALEKAHSARYSPWAFRETNPETQRVWFQRQGRDFVLDAEIRQSVRFEHRNLMADDADLWPPNHYDVVFCRNVMMYFSVEQQRQLIRRIARSLAPGGFLFLGHAETLRGLSEDFHLLQSHGAFYYTRADRAPAPLDPFISHPWRAAAAPADPDDSWLHAIGAATARVEALASRHAGSTASQAKPTDHKIAHVFSLLRREQFSDALELFRELQPTIDPSPDVLLLEAILLVDNGRSARAEETCHRLLAIDAMNAGAHHVLALCREAAGDGLAAMEQNRIAVHLDPSFAMPRLHLGLLARRSGDQNLARRELTQAQSLLQHEDAARLTLFGGGFNRQTILELCGSALRECGGSS